jgi:transposase
LTDVAKRKSSLDKRCEQLEARLRRTERKLEASERRRCHLEANRANLTREIKRLREHNAILQEKVRELTARLSADSTNSSQPPSSDKPWKERRSRKPTGRKPGGQPGHKGTTRKPFPPEDIDREIPVLPERCGSCHRRLRPQDATGEARRHQIVELPPVVAEVFEYVLHEACCPGCGEVTTADLPAGVPTGCVGPRFQAILTLLTGRCRISRREAADVSVALFGEKARISVGTVAALERRTARALKPAYDEALDAVQKAESSIATRPPGGRRTGSRGCGPPSRRSSRCSASIGGATARRSASCSSRSSGSSSRTASRCTGFMAL